MTNASAPINFAERAARLPAQLARRYRVVGTLLATLTIAAWRAGSELERDEIDVDLSILVRAGEHAEHATMYAAYIVAQDYGHWRWKTVRVTEEGDQ